MEETAIMQEMRNVIRNQIQYVTFEKFSGEEIGQIVDYVLDSLLFDYNNDIMMVYQRAEDVDIQDLIEEYIENKKNGVPRLEFARYDVKEEGVVYLKAYQPTVDKEPVSISSSTFDESDFYPKKKENKNDVKVSNYITDYIVKHHLDDFKENVPYEEQFSFFQILVDGMAEYDRDMILTGKHDSDIEQLYNFNLMKISSRKSQQNNQKQGYQRYGFQVNEGVKKTIISTALIVSFGIGALLAAPIIKTVQREQAIHGITGSDFPYVYSIQSDSFERLCNTVDIFYENANDYGEQYSKLGIYEAYRASKGNNYLMIMDKIVQEHGSNSFVQFALGVVRNANDKNYNRLASAVSEYVSVMNEHPNDNPYSYLSGSAKRRIDKLLNLYEDCSKDQLNELADEIIDEQKSEGHSR